MRRLGRRRLYSKKRAELVAFHDFDFEQTPRDTLEGIAIGREDVARLFVGIGEDPLDLAVDFLCRLLAVKTPLLWQREIEEARPLLSVVIYSAQYIAHAELGDHGPCDVGRPLQVVLGAGGDL